MKVQYITQTDLERVIQENIERTQMKNTYVYYTVSKIVPFILQFMTIIITAYSTAVLFKEKDIKEIALMILWCFFTYVLLTVVHEGTHIVAVGIVGKKSGEVYLTVGQRGISVLYNGCLIKKKHVFYVISPYVLVNILMVGMFLAGGDIYKILWVLMSNLCVSVSDIMSCIYLVMKIPKKSFLYGNYYSLKEEVIV